LRPHADRSRAALAAGADELSLALLRVQRPAQDAARIVVAGELGQQGVQRLVLLGAQRGEELVLEPLHDRAELDEPRAARGRQLHHVSAAIAGIALADDELA